METAYLGKYPRKLKTIGDHIRKHRLDLGLKQKERSRIIGVTRAMISAWEVKHVEPAVKHIPKIIEFLGMYLLREAKRLGNVLPSTERPLAYRIISLLKNLEWLRVQ